MSHQAMSHAAEHTAAVPSSTMMSMQAVVAGWKREDASRVTKSQAQDMLVQQACADHDLQGQMTVEPQSCSTDAVRADVRARVDRNGNPKLARNSFFHFKVVAGPMVKAAYPRIGAVGITKVCAATWKSMNAPAKGPYEMRAREECRIQLEIFPKGSRSGDEHGAGRRGRNGKKRDRAKSNPERLLLTVDPDSSAASRHLVKSVTAAAVPRSIPQTIAAPLEPSPISSSSLPLPSELQPFGELATVGGLPPPPLEPLDLAAAVEPLIAMPGTVLATGASLDSPSGGMDCTSATDPVGGMDATLLPDPTTEAISLFDSQWRAGFTAAMAIALQQQAMQLSLMSFRLPRDDRMGV